MALREVELWMNKALCWVVWREVAENGGMGEQFNTSGSTQVARICSMEMGVATSGAAIGRLTDLTKNTSM